MSSTLVIEQAQAADLPALETLLQTVGLNPVGLAEQLASTLMLRNSQDLLGCAALELYGQQALLRSVAVHPLVRGQGWGVRLTCAALAQASTCGVTAIFLLTETAADFFGALGFRPLDRSRVPSGLHRSLQWQQVCPAHATVMHLMLA